MKTPELKPKRDGRVRSSELVRRRFNHWIVNLGSGYMVSQHRTLKSAKAAIKIRRRKLPSQRYEIRPIPSECPCCHGEGVIENKRHTYDECPLCWTPPNSVLSD